MTSLNFSHLPIFDKRGNISSARLRFYGIEKLLSEIQIENLLSTDPIEHMYWHENGLNDYPSCPTCLGSIKTFVSRVHGYRDFCGLSCMQQHPDTKAKKIKRMKLNYGEDVNNASQLSHANRKKQETVRANLGVDWPTQSPIVLDKIKESLQQIDPLSGKTKEELRVERIRSTREERGYQLPFDQMDKYDQYTSKVWSITRKQPLNTLTNYELRKRSCDDPHQLDHKFSMMEGFRQGIAPEVIGSIHNLEYIPMKENNSKGANCSITLECLLRLTSST